MDHFLNSHFAARSGFWGTTTTPFCEVGYLVTPYIAEFWNCISNCAYLFVGISGLVSAFKRNSEWRFKSLHLFVILIGLGSGLYHMTMMRSWSLLDIGPMIGFCFSNNYVYVMMGAKKANLRWLVALVFAILCVGVLHVSWVHPEWFNLLFLAVAGSSVPTAFFWCLDSPEFAGKRGKKEIYRRIAFWFLACSLFGIASLVWCGDKILCGKLRALRAALALKYGVAGSLLAGALEFHAWWHLLTALALHTTSTLGEYLRRARLGTPARFGDILFCRGGVFPKDSGMPHEKSVA
ncbi:putative alkaline phytoceramidase [Paratrimastix pyriformis]|uniref:Alkaline phytoceramidase n=1 Tax=Paratrimastix pyriformis TaxID=342808 RepID=A0ABQ8UF86_9EUKA|nr:putative alkaline phytoceramidase [Paratrimastix pyriformis]